MVEILATNIDRFHTVQAELLLVFLLANMFPRDDHREMNGRRLMSHIRPCGNSAVHVHEREGRAEREARPERETRAARARHALDRCTH